MPFHGSNAITAVVTPHIFLVALAAFVVALIALYVAHNSRR